MKHSNLTWHDPADKSPEQADPARPVQVLLHVRPNAENVPDGIIEGTFLPDAPPMPPHHPGGPVYCMAMAMFSPEGIKPVHSPLDPGMLTLMHWAYWPKVSAMKESH